MSDAERTTTSEDPAGTTDSGRAGQAANLFDLRRIIGGLFVVYGVILTVVGLVSTSDADIAKAAGVHVNLLAGIGMLVMGGLFIAWALLRPLSDQLDAE
jgi:predicted ABC-type sugar transport system permease subunit